MAVLGERREQLRRSPKTTHRSEGLFYFHLRIALHSRSALVLLKIDWHLAGKQCKSTLVARVFKHRNDQVSRVFGLNLNVGRNGANCIIMR